MPEISTGDFFKKRMSRPMMSGLAVIVAVTLFATGCHKSSAVQSPSDDVRVTNQASAEHAAASEQPPLAAQPAVAQSDIALVLGHLTQAIRKYGFEQRRVPGSFNELAAAGYLKTMPEAPTGKKFAINPKSMEAILVDQ
jgi:hypothetical protein